MRSDENPLFKYWATISGGPSVDQGLLAKSREAAESLNLDQISLGDFELQILRTLVQAQSCRKFVEIGTLTGSSGLAIIESLAQGGEFFTFEKNPRHAELARPILEEAGQKRGVKVHILVGDAEEKLSAIADQGPFDGIFIDGNKGSYLTYLEWAQTYLKKGGVVIADNVFLGGRVWGGPTERFSEKQAQVMNQFNQSILKSEFFQGCLLPTAEGLLFAVKLK